MFHSCQLEQMDAIMVILYCNMIAALSYILGKQHLFYCDLRVLDTVVIKIAMSNSFPFIGANLQDSPGQSFSKIEFWLFEMFL